MSTTSRCLGSLFGQGGFTILYTSGLYGTSCLCYLARQRIDLLDIHHQQSRRCSNPNPFEWWQLICRRGGKSRRLQSSRQGHAVTSAAGLANQRTSAHGDGNWWQ